MAEIPIVPASQRTEIDEQGVKWVLGSDGKRLRKWWPGTYTSLDFARDINFRNPYVALFLREPFVAKFKGTPNWKSIFNHRGIAKEVSEAYSVVSKVKILVEEICQGNWSKVTVFDIGCGKGFLGTILAATQPDCNVVMLDKNKFLNLMHLKDLPNISFSRGDILHDPTFLERFVQSKMNETPGRTISIITGIHLCGLLAEKLIETYLHLESTKGFVLVPCCLCSSKLSEVSIKAKPLSAALDNYSYWCLHLLYLLPRNDHSRVSLDEDDDLLSPKNRIIVASKQPPRNFQSKSQSPSTTPTSTS